MKILLCSPDTCKPVFNQAGKVFSLTGICPPLGIGYLGAILMQAGYDVVLYDWHGVDAVQIESAIRKESPDVVGVSCFTITRGAAIDITRLVKSINAGIITVLGGSHASALPGQLIANYSTIDYIVTGEGEMAFLELVRSLEKGENKLSIAGVCSRINTATLRREAIRDLDILPFPVRKLSNNPPYKPFPEKYRLGEQTTLVASRGCPYRCQFCSTATFWGNKYRMRSVENVINEIEMLLEDGVREIEILDDAFTARKQWTFEFCRTIVERRLKFEWSATTRVNYIDDDLCREMRKAGCKRLLLGIESFSDIILKKINKKITSAEAVNALRIARKSGLRTCCMLMVGNPGESDATIADDVNAIKSEKPDEVNINYVQVLPQTDLYDLAVSQGFMDDSYWLDEGKGAPIYTVEKSMDELRKYTEMIYDAHWSSRWFVSISRKIGLTWLKKILCHMGNMPGSAVSK